MKLSATFLLLVLLVFMPEHLCLAKEKTIIADKLTKNDVRKHILSGEISSTCGMNGFSESNNASLNPSTIIIKGIFQDNYEATIHFMGRLKKNVRADERPVVCEAKLQRLNSGEWLDPKTGNKLKK